MKIFRNSLWHEFATTAMATFIVLLGITITTQLVRFLALAASGSISFAGVFALLALTAFSYLPVLLSLTLFITVLMTLSRSYRESEMVIWFGSGLSLLNRVSPKTLTEVLSYAYTNRIIASDFIDSLPIAGVDGTLKKRFRQSDVQGRVMAKTGYLNNVRALSGYVFTKQGDVLVFSILDNGLGWKTKEFQNNLLSELVGCCGPGAVGNSTIN